MPINWNRLIFITENSPKMPKCFVSGSNKHMGLFSGLWKTLQYSVILCQHWYLILQTQYFRPAQGPSALSHLFCEEEKKQQQKKAL